MPRIFAGYEINFAEHAQRALRDIFEIADRCRDDVEATRHAPILASSRSKRKSNTRRA